MIDIHCHILPAVDDGADSLETALEMARVAAATGVTDIAATPHFRGVAESFEMLPEIERARKALSDAVRAEGIGVKLHGGAEILCVAETPYLPKHLRLPTLGEGKYLLCEFYFDESAYFMSDILSALREDGYIPVVAHPERYDAVQRDPRLLVSWFREGYILQANKGSILGTLGRGAERAADFMLDSGLCHLIAGDAHGLESRTTDMRELRRYVHDYIDGEYGRILLRENPRRILEGKRPVPVG